MIRFATALLLVLAISGCDSVFDELSRLLWGVEATVTIISPEPVTISSSPIRFELPEPARVVGTMSGLCLSLRGDFPLAPAKVMSTEFNSLLGGAVVSAVVTTTTGRSIPFVNMSQTWSASGKIEKHNELSTCIREAETEQRLALGVEISTVEITSTSQLTVRGVYWESSNAWDQAKDGN